MQHKLPSIKQAVSMGINGIYLVCKQMHSSDPEKNWKSASTLNAVAVHTPFISASKSHETKLRLGKRMRVLRDASLRRQHHNPPDRIPQLHHIASETSYLAHINSCSLTCLGGAFSEF
jgi:hypothetical protein